MDVDGKSMGGKDGGFLDDVAPISTRYHEKVKGDGKKGLKMSISLM
jgi:hypothetical protein